MKITTVIKYAWKLLFGGGVSGIIEEQLQALRDYLAGLGDVTREKLRGALNLSLKVLSVLKAVRVLVPTKWQTAYALTVEAVESCVKSLEDLDLTKDDLAIIADKVTAAYDAWRGGDDETCVEPECRD